MIEMIGVISECSMLGAFFIGSVFTCIVGFVLLSHSEGIRGLGRGGMVLFVMFVLYAVLFLVSAATFVAGEVLKAFW